MRVHLVRRTRSGTRWHPLYLQRKAIAVTENPKDPWSEDEAEKAGATEQDYGNLSVEDDAQGTVDPADLAGTGDSEDDGGPQNP